ncbi:hypothetical protein [Bradyrhizobium sp. Ash2021]|uniref:hypothetical protein n=1 Tax=Bradyrhizobium sp. Ash2021 TaxID=2954771 RepID=UPI002814B0BA|nr:hypothetical protein [Bradyrhizobium sp. Ash2021]WMT72604.1 hypothetical protein NL528_31925 [Bradyrhizobium sp. Ash2021]
MCIGWPGKSLLVSAAFGLYFIAAHWSVATYIPDPNSPPPSAGIRVQLHPLYVYGEFSASTGETTGLFQQLADHSEADFSSPTELWEGNERLGPAHSTLNEIVSLGKGRFYHHTERADSVVVFSSSDNTSPMTNGRTYWIVNPGR